MIALFLVGYAKLRLINIFAVTQNQWRIMLCEAK